MADTADFGPRKTIFILAIVAGCFAVLWPKIFYPMLTASVNSQVPAADSSSTIRQERRTPPHAGGLHPAMRERGRTIPSSHIVPKVKDRPDHVTVPKMRPPMGGAGHVVPPPKGNGTMGIVMPLYTLGIVLFFLYTIVKVLRKNTDSEIISEYPGAAAAEKEFRKMVFSPEALASAMTGTLNCKKERTPSPPRPAPTIEELKDQAAGDIEIDQLRRRLVETEAAMERIVAQMGSLSRSVTHSPSPQPEAKEDTTEKKAIEGENDAEAELEEPSPTVKVIGMEMTASCEGGQKWSRPSTPVIPSSHSHIEREKTSPKPIYLEGALPPQCELLVTDSETQAETVETDAEAPVVLSGKMTLSLISLDQIPAQESEENGIGESPKEEEIADEVAVGKFNKVKVDGMKDEEEEIEYEEEDEGDVEVDEIEVEEEEEEVEEEEIEEEEVEEEEVEVEEEEVEETEEEEEEEEDDEEEEDEEEEKKTLLQNVFLLMVFGLLFIFNYKILVPSTSEMLHHF